MHQLLKQLQKMRSQDQTIVSDNNHPSKNSTRGWGLAKCGEVLPELQERSEITTNLLDIIRNDPVYVPKHSINYNPGSHSGDSDLQFILRKQTCLYDILTRWNQLATDLGIVRWAAHGGSAMGAKCYGGINPWDDDIDITVLDCEDTLDKLWKNGEKNISSRYPTLDPASHSMNKKGVLWEGRLIPTADGEVILSRGSRCCSWYKLMTVEEAFLKEPGRHIQGIDLECMSRETSRRERQPRKVSNWTGYMKSNSELYTVPFGPTTIQVVEPNILNRYLELRYAKKSPCQFPFANGLEDEKFHPVYPSTTDESEGTTSVSVMKEDQDQSQMDFALQNWYVPKKQRNEWLNKKGDRKQREYTNQLPNLDKIEIDNSISPGCSWGENATIKLIGWNAERGKYWNKFYEMIQEDDMLQNPLVLLMNEMDIGMARTGNVHTVRRLALKLGMNYAYGVEFLELTRGTKEEQDATKGGRDALSLHGNAILTKCILGDGLIIRDPLDRRYFSDKAERGFNADGYEVRLGGRAGIFARIFQEPSPAIPEAHNLTEGSFYVPEELPPHFVVGNIHKLNPNARNKPKLWSFYGFGAPPSNSTSTGTDLAPSQHGVIVQGDMAPQVCQLGGLWHHNDLKKDKTFRAKCLPDGKSTLGPLRADYFCSNMVATRRVHVTPPCDWSNNTNPLTLADHAIVSVEVKSNKKNMAG